MKEVLEFVEQKKQEFAQLPLCKFMQDTSIDPKRRLAWAPCLAPFAMGFGDLNKYVLRQEPTTDKIQQLINLHTYEDDHHWVWFLEDLKKLGLDHSLKFTDAMRFFWSDDTQKTRQVCHQIAVHTFGLEPIVVMAAVEAIEATGNVVLSLTAQVAQELQLVAKQNYLYFGQHHFCVETGHAVGTDDVEQFLASIELTASQTEQALKLVEKVFEVFTDCLNELMTYVETHSIAQPFAKANKARNSKPVEFESFEPLDFARLETGYGASPSHLKAQPAEAVKPIGSYLVEAGLLTPDKLQAALDRQKVTGDRLGKVIADYGWVQQQTIEYMMEQVIKPKRESASLVAVK